MFVILTYDVNEKRVSKIGKICKKYLWKVHRSVYNGNLTEKQFSNLKQDLQHYINPEEDSVCFFTSENSFFINTERLGVPAQSEQITL